MLFDGQNVDQQGNTVGDINGSFQSDQVGYHIHQIPIRKNIGTSTITASGAGVGTVVYDNTEATGGAETRPNNAYVRWYIRAN